MLRLCYEICYGFVLRLGERSGKVSTPRAGANQCMVEILWHHQKTRCQTEKINLNQ